MMFIFMFNVVVRYGAPEPGTKEERSAMPGVSLSAERGTDPLTQQLYLYTRYRTWASVYLNT